MRLPEHAQHHIDNIATKCASIKPLVVIRCITYNHELYLADALEGFVSQNTDFPFVAIIHDDASTDNTTQIIADYAARYPNIILPIFEKENQYSKPDGSLGKIMDEASRATGAKYAALCEGDDYWTDPNKLQLQVDFLESHTDYTMCFHNALVHYENGYKEDHLMWDTQDRDYDVLELSKAFIVPTASILMRTSVYQSKYYKDFQASSKFIYGDSATIRCCGMTGKIRGFSNIASVYRIQPNGALSTIDDKRYYKLSQMEEEYIRVFGERFRELSISKMVSHTDVVFRLLLKGNFKEALGIFGIAFKHAPIKTLRYTSKHLIKALTRHGSR